MEEPREDDNRCPICDRSVFAEGAPYFLEVSFAGFGRKEEDFCSWEHLAEWARRGKPEFDVGMEEYETSVWARVMDVLVPVAIGAWTLFSGYAVFVLIS